LILILPAAWLSSFSLVLVFLIVVLFTSFDKTNHTYKYSIFSAKPLVLGIMTSSTQNGDPRAAKIDSVFRKYNCPLEGLGKVFVLEADRNNIPYWIVAAIAFQESSCGKQIPYVDDKPSYNAWGWAVYGDQVRTFESWENGIQVVSRYMGERFFSRGVTDLCEIMKTYTPPSKGSWCKGVEFYQDEIHEFESPKH